MTDSSATSSTTSVVIAAHTFERCEDLTRAVASALDQRPKPYDGQVVAVDNNADLYQMVSGTRTATRNRAVDHPRYPGRIRDPELWCPRSGGRHPGISG